MASPVLSYFASHLWKQSICTEKSKLLRTVRQECFAFQKLDSAGQRWSRDNYPNGFTSYSSLDRLMELSPTFQELRNKIDKEVMKFSRVLEFDLEGRKLEMTTLWVNIMETHCTHSWHIHPNSVISGSFYVQLPTGSSPFKIEDPRHGLRMNAPPAKKNAKEQAHIHIVPDIGDVILFESWMRHEVPPSRAKEPRISVSFNYEC